MFRSTKYRNSTQLTTYLKIGGKMYVRLE